jgi:DNA replicative helicase MCM subunit Mcm2 (Cdc46/Mcm family)
MLFLENRFIGDYIEEGRIDKVIEMIEKFAFPFSGVWDYSIIFSFYNFDNKYAIFSLDKLLKDDYEVRTNPYIDQIRGALSIIFHLSPKDFFDYLLKKYFESNEDYKKIKYFFWDLRGFLPVPRNSIRGLRILDKEFFDFYFKSPSRIQSPMFENKGVVVQGVLSNVTVKTITVYAELETEVNLSEKNAKKKLKILKEEGWKLVRTEDYDDYETERGKKVYRKIYKLDFTSDDPFFITSLKPSEYKVIEKITGTLVEGIVVDDALINKESTFNIPLKFRYLTPNNFNDDVNRIAKSGSRVALIGVLKAYSKKKIGEGEWVLDTYGIENVDTTISSIDSEKKIKEMKKFIEEEKQKGKSIFDIINEYYAPYIFERKYEKTALMLQIIGPGRKNTSGKSAIHLLFFGNPETGKTQLATELTRITTLSKIVPATNITEPGLIGSVQQIKDRNGSTLYTFIPGDALFYDNGVLIIDEFDKADGKKLANVLHTVMDPGNVSISKATIRLERETSVGITIVANPKKGVLHMNGNSTEEDLAEVFPSALLSRFDLIFIFDDSKKDVDKLLDSMFEAYGPELMRPADQYGNIAYEKKREFLRNWIALSKFGIENVMFTRDSLEYLKERLKEHIKKITSNEKQQKLYLKRKFVSVTNLCFAMARLYLDKQVRKEHIDDVMELLEYVESTFKMSETMEETGIPEERLKKFEVVYDFVEKVREEKKEKYGNEHVDISDLKGKLLEEKWKKFIEEKIKEKEIKDFNVENFRNKLQEFIDEMESKGIIKINEISGNIILVSRPREILKKNNKPPPEQI